METFKNDVISMSCIILKWKMCRVVYIIRYNGCEIKTTLWTVYERVLWYRSDIMFRLNEPLDSSLYKRDCICAVIRISTAYEWTWLCHTAHTTLKITHRKKKYSKYFYPVISCINFANCSLMIIMEKKRQNTRMVSKSFYRVYYTCFNFFKWYN